MNGTNETKGDACDIKTNHLFFFFISIVVTIFITSSVVSNQNEEEISEYIEIIAQKNEELSSLYKQKVSYRREAINLNDSISNLLAFNENNVQRLIDFYHIKHPTVVYSQSILETNTYRSAIFSENNNLFGMKLPLVRPTTAIGTNKGHSKYKNYIDSIKDYKLYQTFCYNDEKYGDDYYHFLESFGYAVDKNYILKIRHVESGLFP